jgi:hypothetical protein
MMQQGALLSVKDTEVVCIMEEGGQYEKYFVLKL